MAIQAPFANVERIEIGPAGETSRIRVTIDLTAFDGATTWISLTAKVDTPPLDPKKALDRSSERRCCRHTRSARSRSCDSVISPLFVLKMRPSMFTDILSALSIIALFLMVMVGAPAADAADIKAQAGQPLCQQLDQLHEYLLALIQRNADEMHRLDCGGLPQGTRLTILEDLPSESEIGHVARVRAFILGGGGSIVGYTLIVTP